MISPFIREIGRDIGIAYTTVVVTVIHGEEFIEKVRKFVGLQQWIERRLIRRKGDSPMSLITSIENAGTEVAALVELEPMIVKFVEDAIADYPEMKADGEAILQKVEAIFHAPPPATTTPAAAA